MFSQPAAEDEQHRAHQRRRPLGSRRRAGRARERPARCRGARPSSGSQERPVRVEPEQVLTTSVDEDRHRHPVAVLRRRTATSSSPTVWRIVVAGDQERPVVADEPLRPTDHEPHDDRDAMRGEEHARAPRSVRAVDGRIARELRQRRSGHRRRNERDSSPWARQRRRTTIRHHSSSSCARAASDRRQRGRTPTCPDGRK